MNTYIKDCWSYKYEILLFNSTISLSNFIIPIPGWNLAGSKVPSLQWRFMSTGIAESNWLSSISTHSEPTKRAAIVGYNGAIDESWTSRFDSGVAQQRPALYLIKRTPNRFNQFILTYVKMQYVFQRLSPFAIDVKV